jgi:mono/diheme cytochrome c family protein
MRTVAALLPCALGLLAPVAVVYAQPARTANDTVYSDGQATRGRALYQAQCARCHGDSLEGKAGPPLTANAFLAVWGSQPLSELASKIRNTMPLGDPGKLKPSEVADVVAYILQIGKFPSGKNDLPSDETALKSIALTPAKPQAAAFGPLGNLNQVMRGILFPSSNIIFNVQLNDPGAPAKPVATGAPGTSNSFSLVDWGAGIYSGWQIVDYAAVAIAESAPLMLTPGRRCENGKPVPLDRPDWIKFTQELAEAGRVAYRASQTRNQQAVSDATSQLADACFHCHQVYRDKRGAGIGNPAAGAARCTP